MTVGEMIDKLRNHTPSRRVAVRVYDDYGEHLCDPEITVEDHWFPIEDTTEKLIVIGAGSVVIGAQDGEMIVNNSTSDSDDETEFLRMGAERDE